MDFVHSQEAKKLFTVVSTFAGGGGSSTGYRLAGGHVLAINEFIPEAQKTYALNFPHTHIFRQDIRKLTGKMILDQIGLAQGELDIFDGSPPCSSFSMAGLREKGWGRVKKYSDSEQRTDDLFFEFARLLKEIQPRVFIAENVKGLTLGAASGLLGSDQMSLFGDHEDTIYHTLCNCGYNVRFKVLNAAHYGVPQARERTIFIGVRKDIRKEISYPPINKHTFVSAGEAIEDIELAEKDFIRPTKGTMTNALWDNTEIGHSFEEASIKLYGKKGWFSFQKLDPTRPACTFTTKADGFFHWEEKRIFDIQEIKRFFSMPEDYRMTGNYTKDAERLGRMVPPLMYKAVAEHVYNTILK